MLSVIELMNAIRYRVILVTTNYQGSSYGGYYELFGFRVFGYYKLSGLEFTMNYQGSSYQDYYELPGSSFRRRLLQTLGHRVFKAAANYQGSRFRGYY